MDSQNTITFYAEIPQSEIANGGNLFLWDNYGSPFDDFFVYQPPSVQKEVVFDASSAATDLLSPSTCDFSLQASGVNVDLSKTQTAWDNVVNSDFYNDPISSHQNHSSFQSVQGAGITMGCNVNKDNGNAHLQINALHTREERSTRDKVKDYYLWNMDHDGKTRKFIGSDQSKLVSKAKCRKRYRDNALKQLPVSTKKNASIKINEQGGN